MPGTAEGRIVVDKLLMDGTLVRGLVLVFSGGRLTSMTAASGLQAVKRQYDEAGKGKDQLGYIDIGLNPAAKVPVGAGTDGLDGGWGGDPGHRQQSGLWRE